MRATGLELARGSPRRGPSRDPGSQARRPGAVPTGSRRPRATSHVRVPRLQPLPSPPRRQRGLSSPSAAPQQAAPAQSLGRGAPPPWPARPQSSAPPQVSAKTPVPTLPQGSPQLHPEAGHASPGHPSLNKPYVRAGPPENTVSPADSHNPVAGINLALTSSPATQQGGDLYPSALGYDENKMSTRWSMRMWARSWWRKPMLIAQLRVIETIGPQITSSIPSRLSTIWPRRESARRRLVSGLRRAISAPLHDHFLVGGPRKRASTPVLRSPWPMGSWTSPPGSPPMSASCG